MWDVSRPGPPRQGAIAIEAATTKSLWPGGTSDRLGVTTVDPPTFKLIDTSTGQAAILSFPDQRLVWASIRG